MSVQKIMLDATCATRGFWSGRKLPSNLVCMDARSSVKPDIVGDCRFLPFREGVFDIVYFDPPHKHGYGGFFRERFGGYGSYEDGRKLLRFSAKEFSRVLKIGGLLIAKLLESPPAPKHHETKFETYMPQIFAEYANAWNLKILTTHKLPSKGMSKIAKVVWTTFQKVSTTP